MSLPRKTGPRQPKAFAGKCGCGKLGRKSSGIITCDECVRRDERGGHGIVTTSGVRAVLRRGTLHAEAAT